MRVRLILAFGLVALIPILAITVFARLGVARQVEVKRLCQSQTQTDNAQMAVTGTVVGHD